MTEYITSTMVKDRLTAIGYQFAADSDDDGTVHNNEESSTITPSIKYAGALVDEAVTAYLEPEAARSQNNQWLMDRCLDIAVVYALETGGREVPKHLRDRHDFSIERLEQLRDEGLRVPGLVLETATDSTQSPFKPRVRNVR